MKETKNLGGRPTTKDKPAMLMYRIVYPENEDTSAGKWSTIKEEGEGKKTVTLYDNKAIAKAELISFLEKENIAHSVEYKILLVMENKILTPKTTTKFVEESISEGELTETEPVEEVESEIIEDDMPPDEKEKPEIGD